MKKLLIILLLVVIPFLSFSQQNKITTTNTVTFTADITAIIGVGVGGAFNPLRDSLFVEGLDWDGETTVIGSRMMLNVDSLNPGIYTATLLVSSTLDSVRWKFKAAPPYYFLNAGWETGTDRWFTFSEDSSIVTLPVIIPRIYPGWNPPPLILTINLDMSGAINRYNGLPISVSEIEFIGLKSTISTFGNMLAGCWCSDDTSDGSMVLLDKINENNWRFEKEVPLGTNSGMYEYKFAVMYSGADTINGGIEPLNNEFVDTLVHTVILVDGPPIVINNLFGDPNPVSVELVNSNIPNSFNLEQNYPNPFNPTTKIRYSIPEHSFISLKVFTMLGEEIETLFNGEQSAGVYEATFDASNLSSGIYFYTLQTKNFTLTKKMTLIR